MIGDTVAHVLPTLAVPLEHRGRHGDVDHRPCLPTMRGAVSESIPDVLPRRRVSVDAKPPLRRAPAIYLDARRTKVCALNEPATLRVSALPLAEK